MTTQTSIYSLCPVCHENALVQHIQGTYRCAACNFDYLTLAGDRSAREAWILENLRQGPMAALFVMFLHRRIVSLPDAESNAQVYEFAAQHGIKLPTGRPLSAWRIVAYVFGGLALLFTAIALLNYFVFAVR